MGRRKRKFSHTEHAPGHFTTGQRPTNDAYTNTYAGLSLLDGSQPERGCDLDRGCSLEEKRKEINAQRDSVKRAHRLYSDEVLLESSALIVFISVEFRTYQPLAVRTRNRLNEPTGLGLPGLCRLRVYEDCYWFDTHWTS